HHDDRYSTGRIAITCWPQGKGMHSWSKQMTCPEQGITCFCTCIQVNHRLGSSINGDGSYSMPGGTHPEELELPANKSELRRIIHRFCPGLGSVVIRDWRFITVNTVLPAGTLILPLIETCPLNAIINGDCFSRNGRGRQHFSLHRRAIGSGWTQISLIHQRGSLEIEYPGSPTDIARSSECQ